MAQTTPPIPDDEAPTRPIDALMCPRCNSNLTDPSGLGWCPGCGYCRSLEVEGKTIAPAPKPATPKKPSALGASEFREAMRRMPRWVWPLLAGMAVVAGIAVVGDYLLDEVCLARAVWSATQIVLGIVGLIAAQLWAALLVGAEEDGLGARDVVLPGRLWRAVFRQLPATRKPVWLGGWCLSATICAVAIIGGFNYWLELVKTKQLKDVAEAAANRTTAKDTAKQSDDDSPSLSAAALLADDNKKAIQCVVIGYQGDGFSVSALVLAGTTGDHLYYVGTVREGIGAELRRELQSRLSRLRREQPLIPGLTINGTTWVNPGVFCDVTRTGSGEITFKGMRD
jgi:hypothetical protein